MDPEAWADDLVEGGPALVVGHRPTGPGPEVAHIMVAGHGQPRSGKPIELLAAETQEIMVANGPLSHVTGVYDQVRGEVGDGADDDIPIGEGLRRVGREVAVAHHQQFRHEGDHRVESTGSAAPVNQISAASRCSRR